MSRGNILMVVHSYCPADPRVRREAEALVDAGWGVDVLCLRDVGQSSRETVGGVLYLRFPLRRRRGGAGRYAFEYATLLGVGLLAAVVLHGFRRYRVVQAHNMPDFLVFCGLVPWITGTSMVLDLHDPIPELYMSKFDLPDDAPLIRALTRIEGLCMTFADHCFAATGAFRDRLVQRGRCADRVTVLLNSPDPRIFSPRAGNGPGPGPTLLFHGTVTERSGVDLAIRAAERVRGQFPDLRFVILGGGDFLPEVRRLVAEGDRAQWIEVRGAVPLEEVPGFIASADLGIVPNRSGGFSDLALPTRLLEYLSMERAAIVSRSPAIRDLFEEEDVLFFEPGDEEDLVRVLAKSLADDALRARYVKAGGRVLREHGWAAEKRIYLERVESLAASAR